ncbi:hypothetical protein SAMN05216368_1381 [Cryobacterium flavum]|uniref:Uncharacterized protein n=1 Tax=Cryobacterium flavum TaxID=1424659 RepID=A0A4R8V1S9_9MICO|nr:hypothetical protein [Cryobacterium flavum]TFB74988.1 hypothetical protein E3O21_13450 [Cryobacterium flavum]SDO67871.1 hypothetical protein SAMN05216368_1381 [Cryobacterium flavum]
MSQSEDGRRLRADPARRSVKYLAVLSVVCFLPGVPILIFEAGTTHIGAVLTISGVIFLSTYELIRATAGRL